MLKKHEELLKCLYYQMEPMTGKQLAKRLSISPRSVRNYINIINSEASKKIILSSDTGYTVNRQLASNLLTETYAIPQSSEERAFFIIKQLLLSHSPSLDLYDLCDELFVGLSTLKKDIYSMNSTFSKFNMHFFIAKDTICISGDEKDKRRLVSYVISKETKNKFINADIIKESFDDLPVDKINDIIKHTFKQYNHYLNDFASANLLLHIAIIIGRVIQGNSVSYERRDFHIEDHDEELLTALCDGLEKEISIKFNSSERFEIYMLIKANVNHALSGDYEMLKNLVDINIFHFVDNITDKINNTYHIDLANNNFKIPFILHLKNLLYRVKNSTATSNPMAQTIRTAYPTIYDIAIFISLALTQQFQVLINEDEVAFLALHIGSEIERQKTNEEKIHCIIFCPDYRDMGKHLENQLLLEFESQIEILGILANEDELNNTEFDFCISTVPISNPNSIVVSPFISQNDKLQIFDLIIQKQNDRKKKILKEQFDLFFSDQLFIHFTDTNSKNEIIHSLTSKLFILNYVDESFEKKVLIRENAASTAFGDIAIPHAMEMDAFKTSICIGISSKGIDWEQQKVYIVLLVAINKEDKQVFHELYEALVLLFSERDLIKRFKGIDNFDDFKTLIFSRLD